MQRYPSKRKDPQSDSSRVDEPKRPRLDDERSCGNRENLNRDNNINNINNRDRNQFRRYHNNNNNNNNNQNRNNINRNNYRSGRNQNYEPQCEYRRHYVDESDDEKAIDSKEYTEVFEIKTSCMLEEFSLDHPDLENLAVTPENMLNAGYCPREKIIELWKQKSRMDHLFDNGKGDLYYMIRDQEFPQDKKGSSRFSNRAGDKLWQVHEAVDLFKNIKNRIEFLDICGGPGAFSQLLLNHAPARERTGWGVSLKSDGTSRSEDWYGSLETDNRFTILYGVDGTGNIYNPDNLDSVAEEILKSNRSSAGGSLEEVSSDDPCRINVVVADGGFKLDKDSDGKHVENYQELYSSRIVLSEVVLMLQTLQEGGNFVCKLFDCFSHATASMIYLLASLFEETYVVKPVRSRIVNSERYLVSLNLKRKDALYRWLRDSMQTIHGRSRPNTHPNSVLPLEFLERDEAFQLSYRKMCSFVCVKQSVTLKRVLDIVYDKHIEPSKPAVPLSSNTSSSAGAPSSQSGHPNSSASPPPTNGENGSKANMNGGSNVNKVNGFVDLKKDYIRSSSSDDDSSSSSSSSSSDSSSSDESSSSNSDSDSESDIEWNRGGNRSHRKN